MEIVNNQRDDMPWARIRTRQKVVAALVAVVVILTVTQLICGATVPESVPLGKFVRVKLDAGEKAIVLSQDFAPVDIISTPESLAFTGLPGRYVVVVLKGDEQPQQFFTAITGAVPPPTPDPKPDPKPDDPPKPPDDADKAPLPNLAGLKVLLIYESGDLPPKVPKDQFNIKVDPEVTGWLSANTTPENGWVGWRVGDPESGVQEGAMHWEKMLSLPRTSLPWIVINDGTNNRGYSGPLPENSAKTLELLKRFK